MIGSINLRNVYSFGDDGTPDLFDFKELNLFIGKNGSGKSNVLRAFYDLHTEFVFDVNQNHWIGQIPERIRNSTTVRLPKLHEDKETDYFTDRDIHIITNSQEIIFKDGILTSGDPSWLRERTYYCQADTSDLTTKLIKIFQYDKSIILDFAFYYIFEIPINFNNGTIAEVFTKYPGVRSAKTIISYSQWSSGYYTVANLLADILLLRKKDIILLDEPELHLEPKVVRKLLNFITWLIALNNDEVLNKIGFLVDEINNQKSSFYSSNSYHKSKIEILENFNFEATQLFVSSHSPSIINSFLSFGSISSIYQFDTFWGENNYKAELGDGSVNHVKMQTLMSKVQKVNNHFNQILDSIGAKGSDILQANGIIWVEGPSDIIYLKKWLEIYSNENRLHLFQQGIDYEFQMFGGTLLDSICYLKTGLDEELKKLVSIFSFSRNSFVVTDSDAIIKNGQIVDNSKFAKAKKFIGDQFDILKSQGYKLGLWYKENNTEIRTIEDYIDDESIKVIGTISESSLTKKIYAQRLVEYWDSVDIKLIDFKYSLENEIKTLYETIKTWNE
jgi:predicted ATP-dependent endonuclease of OLD family